MDRTGTKFLQVALETLAFAPCELTVTRVNQLWSYFDIPLYSALDAWTAYSSAYCVGRDLGQFSGVRVREIERAFIELVRGAAGARPLRPGLHGGRTPVADDRGAPWKSRSG